MLEGHSAQEEEAHQAADTGEQTFLLKKAPTKSDTGQSGVFRNINQTKILKNAAAGEEGCLEEAQEEVLLDDAKCVYADNLRFLQTVIFSRFHQS